MGNAFFWFAQELSTPSLNGTAVSARMCDARFYHSIRYNGIRGKQRQI